MRWRGFRIAIAGLAICLGTGVTAHAAKGVKKVFAPNAHRTVTGHIVNIVGGNGTATLHVRSGYRHRKLGFAGTSGKYHSHTFQMTAATRVEHRTGVPATMASLHRGERVRVRAMGQTAVNVHILGSHRVRGYYVRHRIHHYWPHMFAYHRFYHPHPHHAHFRHAVHHARSHHRRR